MNIARKPNHFIKIHHSNLDEKLSYIKSLALSMGGCVEETISDAKDITIGHVSPEERLPTMKKREEEINFLQLKLAKACFRSLARQAPVAKDLRLILTLLSANTDLERMGDLAINIAHKAKKIETHPSLKKSYSILKRMFDATIEMVRMSLNSFVKEDERLAQKILDMDNEVDACQREIVQESEKIMKQIKSLIPTCIRIILISGNLERIADHSTNLAEEIVFLRTGYDIRHSGRKLKNTKKR